MLHRSGKTMLDAVDERESGAKTTATRDGGDAAPPLPDQLLEQLQRALCAKQQGLYVVVVRAGGR